MVICGLTTNVCVQSTVRDCWQRDYQTKDLAEWTKDNIPVPPPVIETPPTPGIPASVTRGTADDL